MVNLEKSDIEFIISLVVQYLLVRWSIKAVQRKPSKKRKPRKRKHYLEGGMNEESGDSSSHPHFNTGGNKNEMDTRRHNGSWLYCKFVYIRI